MAEKVAHTTLITTPGLQPHLGDPDWAIVDCRAGPQYLAGHIPGAVHLSKGVIERDVEKAVPDPAAPVVLYCGSGFRSALAADNLQKMGYQNVFSMDGGMRGWREKGYPVSKGS